MNEPKHRGVGLKDKNGESVDFFQKKLKFSFPPALWSLARSKKSEKYLATKKINEHLWTYNFLLFHQTLSPWPFLWSIGQTERLSIECKTSIGFSLYPSVSRSPKPTKTNLI